MLFPGDADTKTVILVGFLRRKHPAMCIPDLTDPKYSSFEDSKKYPDIVLLDISEEDVQWVDTSLTGAEVPIGMDVLALQNWLLQFGISSSSIRKDMAAWAECPANKSPP